VQSAADPAELSSWPVRFQKCRERARKRITKYQAFRIAGNQILSLFVYSRCPPVTSRSKSTAKGEEAKNGARRLFQETDLPSLNQEQHFFFLWQGISSSLHATTITLQFTKGNMRFFEDLKVIKS
jgi:hypothetical protein